ncbi:MAG: LPS export ABC transporter permease LptG [Pseudomonadota bacterium]
MRVLDRYIVWTVVGASTLVMAVLLTLLALFLFIGEQSDVGTGNYGSPQALNFVLLSLPTQLFQFLPIAALLGALLGMGTLARGSELTVMRASGVSIGRIGVSVAIAGTLLTVVAVLIGEFLAPPLAQMARAHKAIARYSSINFVRSGGAWVRDGNLILRADRQAGGSAFHGILVFDITSANRLAAVGRAASATERTDGTWELGEFAQTRFNERDVDLVKAPSRPLNTRVSAAFLGLAASNPQELSLRELSSAISYLKSSSQESRQYRFAFWSIVARVVAIPLAVLLALPFLFGSLRASGSGARATLGLILGMGYFILQRMVASGTIAFGLDPTLLAWFPTAVLALAVTVLMARVRG